MRLTIDISEQFARQVGPELEHVAEILQLGLRKDRTRNGRCASLVQRVFVLLGALLAFQARASFHTFKINEIYSSADGSVQFIELRESQGINNQNFLATHFIQCVSGTMANIFIFPTNLSSTITANKTCIIGTANLASIPGGVRPDYVFTNSVPFIFANSGSINYAGVDSVSYTNLPTDGVASLVRSGSAMVFSAANSPVDFDGVSNSIVPVRFTSTALGGTTISLTFLTATGTNGTAGPNYEVQTNGALESAVWGTVTNVGGNGTPITVAIPINAPQQFFRLRVP